VTNQFIHSTVLHVFAMEGHIQEQQAILVEVTKFIESWLTWYTLFKKLVRLTHTHRCTFSVSCFLSWTWYTISCSIMTYNTYSELVPCREQSVSPFRLHLVFLCTKNSCCWFWESFIYETPKGTVWWYADVLIMECGWYKQELLHFKWLNLKPEINLKYTWKFSSDRTQNNQCKEELTAS
jgi:hypothetical protein